MLVENLQKGKYLFKSDLNPVVVYSFIYTINFVPPLKFDHNIGLLQSPLLY